ncbi:MAG TPA: SigE family RNA polymerase sigma factor [Catenuloplanes sp.]
MNTDTEREFGDFVAARSDALCRFAYLLCGDWHRAEDTVQTALTKLYVAWKRVHDREAIDGYVRRIIVNVLASEGRLARFRRERLSGELPDRADGSDFAVSAHDRMAILQALATVPPRQRAVIVLRYWEDQSLEQVAQTLGCSVGTVKSQAARGLSTLRQALGALEPMTSRG